MFVRVFVAMDTPLVFQVLPVRLSEIILATPPWGLGARFVFRVRWTHAHGTDASIHLRANVAVPCCYSYSSIQELHGPPPSPHISPFSLMIFALQQYVYVEITADEEAEDRKIRCTFVHTITESRKKV